MKFGNGCWLQQEGIECFAAQEAYFITKKEKEVSFCVPTHHIVYRGDTLGGVRKFCGCRRSIIWECRKRHRSLN